jgi:hypothetical protein
MEEARAARMPVAFAAPHGSNKGVTLMPKPSNNPKPNRPAAPAAAPVPAAPAKVAGRSEVRNSAIPKVSTAARVAAPASAPRREVTREQIARRAYEIWQSGQGGSEFDNWCRAERELRGK